MKLNKLKSIYSNTLFPNKYSNIVFSKYNITSNKRNITNISSKLQFNKNTLIYKNILKNKSQFRMFCTKNNNLDILLSYSEEKEANLIAMFNKLYNENKIDEFIETYNCLDETMKSNIEINYLYDKIKVNNQKNIVNNNKSLSNIIFNSVLIIEQILVNFPTINSDDKALLLYTAYFIQSNSVYDVNDLQKKLAILKYFNNNVNYELNKEIDAYIIINKLKELELIKHDFINSLNLSEFFNNNINKNLSLFDKDFINRLDKNLNKINKYEALESINNKNNFNNGIKNRLFKFKDVSTYFNYNKNKKSSFFKRFLYEDLSKFIL